MKEIPLFWPYNKHWFRIVWELHKILKTRWWGQGPKVDEFEKAFEKKFDFPNDHAVAVNSGTAALHLAYILAGVKKGDRVITPVLTCTATNHPILQLGAIPVFADVNKNLVVNPDDIEKKITKRTKAIVVVHLGGVICDMNKIMRIAAKYNLPVIEDCAQSLSDKVGLADYSCFSFQAIKTITTGDGGMLVCRDKRDADRAKRLRWFGIDRKKKIAANWQPWQGRQMTFDVDEVGYKYQCTDIDATIGLVQLKYFDSAVQHLKKLDSLYRKYLSDVKDIHMLSTSQSPWLFGIITPYRDKIADVLNKNNVDTNIVQVRNDVYKIFGGKRQVLPQMNLLENMYLYLPLNSKVTKRDVKFICKLIKNALQDKITH